MIDVNGMKATNDTYGHQIGDTVLVTVANALSRDLAVVGRYGGDEFVAILAGADRSQAEAYRDVVMEMLTAARIEDPESGARVPVNVSVGIASYPEEAASVADLIRLSDEAMYAAKRSRPINEGGFESIRPLADERASKMVGELVPLLTSTGDLQEKLRLVGHKLSIGAGYDGVNIVFSQGDLIRRPRSSSVRAARSSFMTWRTTTVSPRTSAPCSLAAGSSPRSSRRCSGRDAWSARSPSRRDVRTRSHPPMRRSSWASRHRSQRSSSSRASSKTSVPSRSASPHRRLRPS
jgi:diguanylate cyclase (GGDEF)-like protein